MSVWIEHDKITIPTSSPVEEIRKKKIEKPKQRIILVWKKA